MRRPGDVCPPGGRPLHQFPDHRRRWARGRHCRTARRRSIALREAELLLVDWGASGRFYKSDLTRVLVPRKTSRLSGR